MLFEHELLSQHFKCTKGNCHKKRQKNRFFKKASKHDKKTVCIENFYCARGVSKQVASHVKKQKTCQALAKDLSNV